MYKRQDVFFAQKDIALVLLDVMMPKMDGWEVLRTIRKYSQVPAVSYTHLLHPIFAYHGEEEAVWAAEVSLRDR